MRNIMAAIFAAFLMVASISAVSGAETVTVAGSTTVLPLAEVCAEAFNDAQSDYKVSVTGGGSGVGIKNVAEGMSNIGMASREVTSDEINQFGDDFQENLVGYDGIVIAISKEIYDSGVTELTKDQVKQIYNGEINNWEDLGGPDELILVIAREQGSGTRDTFNEDIMDDKKAETPGVNTVAGSNAEIKTAITNGDNAIGYLGFSYAQDGKVGVIALDGTVPTEETIKDGSYELNRKLYFYTFGGPSSGAQAFIDFVTGSEGQTLAEENGFVPI